MSNLSQIFGKKWKKAEKIMQSAKILATGSVARSYRDGQESCQNLVII